MVAQICEYTKPTELYTLKRVNYTLRELLLNKAV